jgi:hypothetical protein
MCQSARKRDPHSSKGGARSRGQAWPKATAERREACLTAASTVLCSNKAGHRISRGCASVSSHRRFRRSPLLQAVLVCRLFNPDRSRAVACDALSNVIRQLRSQGITFAFARVRDSVREQMRLGGVEAAVEPANFHERVTDGVRAWQQRALLRQASGGTVSRNLA